MRARTLALALTCLLALPAAAGAHARRGHRAAHASRHHRHRAHAGARTTRVNEYAKLTLNGKGGSTTIDEHGYGWGSFHCHVYITLTLRGTQVTASYRAYPHGGRFAGTAKARIHKASHSYASFSGTIWLHGGNGRFAHASGHAGFYGTIDRHTYAMRVHVVGRVHL